jgi:short-subunit dehydrogenase
VPELPEIEALVDHLRRHAVGLTVGRVDVAALSVLKTFDPPINVLHGQAVVGAQRWGKYLGLQAGQLFLIAHLSRAGWLRWSDNLAAAPLRPGKGPIALRVHLGTPGSAPGFDLTEAGTQKRLAVWLVEDPQQVPGIAALGPDALDLGPDDLAGVLAGNTGRIKTVITDQKVIAGIGPSARGRRRSRAKSVPDCGCTPAPDCPARCVGTPCVKCRSPTSLFSTAPRARPAARCWPTGACRGYSSSRYAAGVTRQKILITGASSGLGAGMARSFAAQGRDLALCARRTDRLDELKAELSQRYPGVKVAVAQLDVNDHEQVPKVFGELSDELGGIDRIIVNAGIGKGAKLGSGKLWANKATIETNLVAALVQIETALEMFHKCGSGHLVLISSVLGNKGVPGVKAAYAASKAGVSSLGESLRAEYAKGPIRVSVMEPGYIESEMTAKSESTMLLVDNETGVKALVGAIEKEPGRAAVPWWPWAPLVQLMRVLPPSLTKRFA